jgi:hypothetical protein
MTAPDRMPEAFENSLHDAGHPHMEPPANPGRFTFAGALASKSFNTPRAACDILQVETRDNHCGKLLLTPG